MKKKKKTLVEITPAAGTDAEIYLEEGKKNPKIIPKTWHVRHTRRMNAELMDLRTNKKNPWKEPAK